MSHSSLLPRSDAHASFKETRWSLICSLQVTQDTVRRRAFNEFCEIYWYPLYLFARRKGYCPEDAEDLTQALFEKLLTGDGLKSLHPEGGRVRSYLLQSFRNLIVGEWRKGQTQRRGGDIKRMSMDSERGEARFLAEVATNVSPEIEFERHYVNELLRHAVDRLKKEFDAAGRAHVFTALGGYLSDEGGASYTEVSEELKMTVSAVKVTVHRMRERFRKLLLDEIRQTVTTPEELDAEVDYICSVYS